MAFVLLANLSRSRVGRVWRAVRDDEVAAEIAGINLGRARVLAFVVSTAAAGLAGAVMAMAVRLTAPSGFTLVLSLTLLTAVVLGGLGSLLGALIGAALLTFLPQVVTNLGLKRLRIFGAKPKVPSCATDGITVCHRIPDLSTAPAIECVFEAARLSLGRHGSRCAQSIPR